MNLKLNIIYFLVIISVAQSSSYTQDIFNFIMDFLEHTNAKFTIFLSCWRSPDAVTLKKLTNSRYIRSSFVSTNNISSIQNQLQLLSKANFLDLVFVADVSRGAFENVLYHMGAPKNYYGPSYKWLFIDTSQNTLVNTSSLATIFQIGLRMDSEVTVAIKNVDLNNTTTNLSLYEVYKPQTRKVNTSIRTTRIGFWNTVTGFNLTNISKYERRKNMSGVDVRAATVMRQKTTLPIDVYYRDEKKKHHETMHKFNYVLFMHLKDLHGFVLNLTVTDKWFGNSLSGTDGGLAKLLWEDQIDVAATSGLMKPHRVPYIDFVIPTYPFRTCFIFRNPGTSGKVRNEFLTPFATTTWYTVSIYGLLFAIILKVTSISEISLTGKRLIEKSWSAAILTTLSAFFQQGASIVPSQTSGRCVIFSLLVMSLFLYNYYTSSVVSSLLSGLPTPFKSIRALSDSNLEVGLEDVIYMRTLFEVTNDSDIKYLYNRKVFPPGAKQPYYLKPEEGIKKVKSGGFAYHTEPSTAYPIIETSFEPTEICELAEINVFRPSVLLIMAQKGSQYREFFAISYQKMIESGILARELIRWTTKKPSCLANVKLITVGFEQTFAAFLMLSVGIILAWIFLGVEMWLDIRMQRTMDKKANDKIITRDVRVCDKVKPRKLLPTISPGKKY